ncbi:hypothetical protein [Bradyrhizobium sp. SZCCHNR1075]|uniref:hypothetical protein n=1 Tax=Bradyrhizobium sp. SZCCHNR1075 TaxID=3057362 RepID=UPI0028E6DFC9|nr:hypothetical protein [Bradyrhizobium sp. SZCCHNR1075]
MKQRKPDAQAPAAGRLAAAMATNCATTRRTRFPDAHNIELNRRIERPSRGASTSLANPQQILGAKGKMASSQRAVDGLRKIAKVTSPTAGAAERSLLHRGRRRSNSSHRLVLPSRVVML